MNTKEQQDTATDWGNRDRALDFAIRSFVSNASATNEQILERAQAFARYIKDGAAKG